jgi:hemolysin activation/secretion protein
LLLLAVAGTVSAATPPTPSPATSAATGGGVQQRSLEQVNPDQYRPNPPLKIEVPNERPMQRAANTEIDVNTYSFRGNTIYPGSTLAQLVESYRGKITFEKLLEATSKITAYYRQHGYLVAHAYVPEQEIKGGNVEINILEGVLGDINFKGDKPISRKRAATYMQRLANTGIINEKDLEYGALLLNDLPGVDASVGLAPGAKPGTTDVTIDMKNEGRYQLAADYNNYGDPVTGEHRFGLQGQVNNLFHAGDRFTLRPIVSNTGDTLFGSLGYDMPLFSPAARVGLQFSHLDSQLGKEFTDLDVENTATSITGNVTYAFVRSRDRNINAGFSYENRNIQRTCDWCDKNNIHVPGLEDADYNLNILQLGANGDWRDKRWGGGINTWYADIRAGLSAVSAEDAGVTVPGGDRIDGQFFSLQLGYQRLQRLSKLWTFNVNLNGQYSGDNLDSSERISLGGPTAVRAYRPSEALGDSGLVMQTELRRELAGLEDRYSWLSKVEVYALLDEGVSQLNSNGSNLSTETNMQRNGVGLGFRLQAGKKLYIDVVGATRISDEPSLVDSPKDAKTNYWAQMIYWF